VRTLLACVLVGAAVVVALACGGSSSTDDESVALPDRRDGGADATDDAATVDGPDASDATITGCADASPTCERIVFATSGQYVGNNIGGIAGADTRCQNRAAASILPAVSARRFRAWISTQASAVRDRLVHGTAAYRMPSGTIVANDWTDLTDGNLQEGIDEDENGAAADGQAWTGTNADGTNGPNECDAWGPSGGVGRVGNVGGRQNGWTDSASVGCGQSHRIYCFEE
jgi:hypothetical protein